MIKYDYLPFHFIEHHHSPNSFWFLITEVVRAKTGELLNIKRHLLKCMAFWTFKLKAIFPIGLNTFITQCSYNFYFVYWCGNVQICTEL